MLKTILGVVMLAVALVAAPAHAVVPDENSAVSKNFKSVGRELRSLGRISDASEMAEKLEGFIATMKSNREEVPSFMEKGTEQYADFQNGVDELIAAMEKALALAQAGDLDGAKEVASGFRDIRQKYHKHFDLEDP